MEFQQRDIRAVNVRVSGDFGEFLRLALERAGLTESEVRAQMPDATASRAFRGGSLKTALRLYEAASELSESAVPSPLAFLEGLEHHDELRRWIEAGEILRVYAPAVFERLLRRAVEVADPIRQGELEEKKARGLEKIRTATKPED